jgi:hypothetical protein
MKKGKISLLLGLFSMLIHASAQVSFTAGNIVVYRVGSGAATLTSASTAVFLDEYTTAGVLVQSIALPVAVSGSNKILTAAGNGHTEGVMTLSTDGQYLVLTGYNVAPGVNGVSGTPSTTRQRAIGLVRYDAGINTSTALTTLSSGGAVRCAVSTNGTDLWACGAGAIGSTGGVHYTTVGATTSTQLTSPSTYTGLLRGLKILEGQLYVSGNSNSPRIGSVGTWLPTTGGQTVTNLPGFPDTVLPGQFALLDLNVGIAGPDVLYFSDDDNGIEKYSLVSGNWVFNGAIGSSVDDYRGFAAKVTGSSVDLYVTRRGSNSSNIKGGQLVSLTDASGYNGAFSATPVVLANSVVDRTAFRGVSLVPTEAVLPIKLVSISAGKVNKDVQLKWTAADARNFSHFEVERSMDGMTFTKVGNIELQQGSIGNTKYSFTDFGILDKTTLHEVLYYRLKMADIDGHTDYSKIVTVKVFENSAGFVHVYPDPFVNEINVRIGVTNAGKISICLADLQGRVVQQLQLLIPAGENTIKVLPPGNLQKGIYLLRVLANDKVTTLKLIK